MARQKWLVWLVFPTLLVAAGAGLWYAVHRGWLSAALAWVQGKSSARAGTSSSGDMDMNMPGMNMGGMGMEQPAETSGVPGLAVVQITPRLQQRIGVRVGVVEETPLRMSVRTVGIVRPNETRVDHVHLKTEGWVEKLFVTYTGQTVHKGDRLLAIYSPQFVTTQQDYLNARQAGQAALAELSRDRLRLWDVPPEEIRELEKSGKARKSLVLRSPIEGTVLEKHAFEGQYVTPRDDLYVVADLSTVWVQAKVYEYELPHVELGQPALVTVPALPEQSLAGKVVFVQPTVEEPARTTQVRVELPNPRGLLKPGMFANVVIEHTMGRGLLVPASAVIRTGQRDYAFRAESGNRFVPVEVEVSPLRFGDRLQVLGGLKVGDQVVASADFLIDSESRLRFGGGGMAGMPGMDMGHGKGRERKGKDHSSMNH